MQLHSGAVRPTGVNKKFALLLGCLAVVRRPIPSHAFFSAAAGREGGESSFSMAPSLLKGVKAMARSMSGKPGAGSHQVRSPPANNKK